MEVGIFFVGKKGIRDPDLVGNLRSDGQLLNPLLTYEGEPVIPPHLAEVKVTRKVHHDLGDGADVHDVHGDSNLHRGTAVRWPDPLVVPVIEEGVEDAGDVGSHVTGSRWVIPAATVVPVPRVPGRVVKQQQ